LAERARVAVLISGAGTNMAALVYAAKAADCPFEIVLVAANDPQAPGLKLAQAEGIATFAHSHRGIDRAAFDAIIDDQLNQAKAEYVALAGYMRMLSDGFVTRWAGRMLNIHPSLLPKYKGLDTYARAIDAGDKVAGCSVHVVTPELDDGPVLGQTEVAIIPGDTPDSLAARIRLAEHQLYPRVLAAYVSRESDPAWLLAQVRQHALALPEAIERQSHGAPAFHIEKGKFFAYFSQDLNGNGITGLLVKTSGADEQAALIAADPDLYFRPAYLGPSGWIGIRLDSGGNDWDHIAAWLAKSWQGVAPKRLTKLIDAAAQF